MEDFRPKLIVSNFASPQGLFSTGQFSVLRYDFLCDFFKSPDLISEFFANVRKNDLPQSSSSATGTPLRTFCVTLKSSDLVSDFFRNLRKNVFSVTSFPADLVFSSRSDPPKNSRVFSMFHAGATETLERLEDLDDWIRLDSTWST